MPHAVQNTRIPDNEPVSVVYGPQAQLAIKWQPQHPQSAGIRHCLQTVGHKLVLLSTWTEYGSHLLSLLFNSCLCHTEFTDLHFPAIIAYTTSTAAVVGQASRPLAAQLYQQNRPHSYHLTDADISQAYLDDSSTERS